jgi:hypothetical protein
VWLREKAESYIHSQNDSKVNNQSRAWSVIDGLEHRLNIKKRSRHKSLEKFFAKRKKRKKIWLGLADGKNYQYGWNKRTDSHIGHLRILYLGEWTELRNLVRKGMYARMPS